MKAWPLTLVLGAALVVVCALPSSSLANSGSQTVACAADMSITVSPTVLWPPDHKLQDISIVGTDTDNNGDIVIIQVIGLASDQPSEGAAGCGKPTASQGPDAVGLGNVASGVDPSPASIAGVQLRAELCAELGARHYTITVFCFESNEGTGTATFTVTVPANQGQ